MSPTSGNPRPRQSQGLAAEFEDNHKKDDRGLPRKDQPGNVGESQCLDLSRTEEDDVMTQSSENLQEDGPEKAPPTHPPVPDLRVARVLEATGAKRMVMGHTVQDEGITSVCDEKAWRIDVGLADYYEGPEQALEIRGDEVRVLEAETASPDKD